MAQVSYGTITITDTTDVERIYPVYCKGGDSSPPSLLPLTNWSETISQAGGSGNFIWQRIVTKKQGLAVTSGDYSDAVRLTGDSGSSLTITSIQYAQTQGENDTPSYSNSMPSSINEGWWLWVKTTYSDGSPVVTKIKQGQKGETGQRGTSILKVTTAPTAYTTTQGGFTPAYRISLSTVKTQSGKSEVLIGDIIEYNSNHYRVGYVDNSYVYLSSATSIKGNDGTSIVTTRELYYLKTNSTNPSQITWNSSTSQPSTTIYSDDRTNAWTSIIPSYVDNSTYYTCVETSLSNSTKTWSAPVVNNALTNTNANALNAWIAAGAAELKVKKVINNSSGVIVTSGINGGDITENDTSTYGYNTIMAPNYLGLRYNAINLAKLTTTESIPALEFYTPTVNGNGIPVQGNKGLSIDENSLKFYDSNGTIKAFFGRDEIVMGQTLTLAGDNNNIVDSSGNQLVDSSGNSIVDFFVEGVNSEGYNTRIDANGFYVRDGLTVLAEYGSSIKFYETTNHTVAAEVGANGLVVKKGSIQIGSKTSASDVTNSGTYIDSSGNMATSNITAHGGTIGGFILNSTQLNAYGTGSGAGTSDTGISRLLIQSSPGNGSNVAVGVASRESTSDSFTWVSYILHNGKFKSSDADITGKITANEGKIGGSSGWTIEAQHLYSGTIGADSSMHLGTKNLGSSTTIAGRSGSDWRLTVGSKFGINNTGNLYCTGGIIGGWTINASTLSRTNSSNTLSLNASGVSITTQNTQGLEETRLNKHNLVLDCKYTDSLTPYIRVWGCGTTSPQVSVGDSNDYLSLYYNLSSENKGLYLTHNSNGVKTPDYAPFSVTTNEYISIRGLERMDFYISSFTAGDTSLTTVGQLVFYDSDSGPMFRPNSNGTVYSGSSANRWNTIFTNKAVNTGSDLKIKDVIEGHDWKIDEFIKGLKPIAYRLKDSESGRIHMGFGAQDVARLSKELNIGDLSVYEAEIITGEEDNRAYHGEEIDDSQLTWGLKYSEFIAPMVLEIQRLMDRVKELEDRLNG